MRRNVFISFLGLGNSSKNPPYDSVRYFFTESKVSNKETVFVQSAMLELLDRFDKIILLSTKSSSQNIEKFLAEIKPLDIPDIIIDTSIRDISDDLYDLNDAWTWFKKLDMKIDRNDIITLDVTHGFRIVPIVFSAAIGYLKRAKNIDLSGVLYGAYTPPKQGEEKKEKYPIVDVKDFYTINDWAEGVGRLVDDADASFLKKVAEKEQGAGFAGLKNEQLLVDIENLTKSVRNVELQKIESNAKTALDDIQNSIENSTSLERQILEMIVEKFTPLICEAPTNGKYSKEYLSLQIRLIELLAQHGLYMQCFTAMREWLGSLGLAISGDYLLDKKKNDERSRQYADIFVNMLQFKEEKWKFDENEDKKKQKDKLLPSYNALKSLKNFELIKQLLNDMQKVRNGFDHGWTGTHISGVPENIKEIFNKANSIFQFIIDKWDNIQNHRNQTNQSSDLA
jgi:CRISPR-associated DxTHG motif protein